MIIRLDFAVTLYPTYFKSSKILEEASRHLGWILKAPKPLKATSLVPLCLTGKLARLQKSRLRSSSVPRLASCRRQSQPCSASPLSNHLSSWTPLLPATLNLRRPTGRYMLVASISHTQVLRLYCILDIANTTILVIFCPYNIARKPCSYVALLASKVYIEAVHYEHYLEEVKQRLCVCHNMSLPTTPRQLAPRSTPTSTSSGLDDSTKVALALGIGLGVPTFIVAALTLYIQWKGYRLQVTKWYKPWRWWRR